MDKELKQSRFKKIEAIHFRVSLFMLLASILLVSLGYIMVKAILPMPEPVIYIVTIYLYAHLLHFGYGVYRLFYFLFKVNSKASHVKVTKTILSILISPISGFLAWLAVFLMVLSSCAG